jgi:hypothetical protein
MFNLGILNTVIALVVVLLVLSLIVQAIQGFIKKIFKLKSREIEKSLTTLFTNIIDKPASAQAAPAGGAPQPLITPEKLANNVMDEFNNIGRYTMWGRTVLESISKEDLLKILARVDSKHFFADYVEKFQNIYTQVEALEQEINNLLTSNPPLLQGAASAKFAEMREVMAPLVNDIKSLLSGNAVRSDVLLGDLINLRRINVDEALNLLAQAQESVAKDIQAERQAGNTATVTALQTLSAALARIAGILGQLGQQADIAFAALRAKLDHVERWYDTVMQSFEERYVRHMKTVSLCISIVVVILLNASFFRIYRNISTSDEQRNLIVKAGEQWLDQKMAARKATKANTAATNTGNNANTNVNSNTNGNSNSNSNNSNAANSNDSSASSDESDEGDANTSANANDNSAPGEPTIQDLKNQVNEIKNLTSTYESYGLSPLTWAQVKSAFTREGIRGALVTILGWFITILLLSVGAPFWQDTLESLFGLKNLLRKKSGTQTVEDKSGEGQQRT